MSAHWTHLNPAWKRASGCKDCTDGVPPGDVHWRCRRTLQLASDGAASRLRLEVAAARRDERHSLAEQLRALADQIDPDQTVRTVPGAATGGTE